MAVSSVENKESENRRIFSTLYNLFSKGTVHLRGILVAVLHS